MHVNVRPFVMFAAATLAACTDPGAARISMDRPSDPALDPLSLAVSEVSLALRAAGETIYATTVAYTPGEALDFGDVPIADDVRFELTLSAPTGRVVGFGRSGEPVSLAPGEITDVVVPVRRPFAYVAGGDELLAVDATREPGTAYTAAIPLGAPTTAVATLPRGEAVIVATGTTLRVVDTATHAPRAGAEVELAAPITALAVSPDGAWLGATHAGGDGSDPGVSIVEVAALLDGAASPAWVDAVRPGEIALSPRVAWVLDEPNDNIFCAGASTLVEIPLDDPGSARAALALDTAAVDLAADPDSGAAALAACGDVVHIVPEGASEPATSYTLSRASAVTVAGGELWIAGQDPVDDDAHLILAHGPVAGGELEELALSPLQERASARSLELPGQGTQLQMTADLAAAFDLVVLPDGEHVAILVAAGYNTTAAGDAGGGQPIVPDLTLVSHEYQLVQLDTGLGAQRLRLRCEIEWTDGALLDDFDCASAPGQDTLATPIQPTSFALVYGSP